MTAPFPTAETTRATLVVRWMRSQANRHGTPNIGLAKNLDIKRRDTETENGAALEFTGDCVSVAATIRQYGYRLVRPTVGSSIVLAADLIHRTAKAAGMVMPLGTRSGTTFVANDGVPEDAVIATSKRLVVSR